MKTRSQREKIRKTPYGERLFLVTEYGGCNGWVVNAVSPSDAQKYFQSEILKHEPELEPEAAPQTERGPVRGGKGKSKGKGQKEPQDSWEEYLELEQKTRSKMTKPCFMDRFHIGKKPYYIETLAFPDQHVAWIPTSFN